MKLKNFGKIRLKRLITTSWFHLGFWEYLLEQPTDPTYTNRWIRFWCRFFGHPKGVWYYNPRGLEPDMHCKNCNDNLG